MLNIPRRYSHFIFGTIQSGLTSLIATGIACLPLHDGGFLLHWMASWLLSWCAMLPIVLAAAPSIRRLSQWLTSDDEGASGLEAERDDDRAASGPGPSRSAL